MNYFKWFIKEGWKKYIFPFIILILIDYGVYMDWDELIDIPIFGLFLALNFILVIHFGIIFHSVITYKQSQNTDL